MAIIGGGGFRVPLVIRALRSRPSAIDHVVLFDADPSRLAVIRSVLGPSTDRLRITAALDLSTALRGCDFVFSAIRVGGTDGRVRDERRAIRAGLLGQETVGAGGLAYGLRTVPVVDEIARTVAQVAPQAWVVNFTNPAGLVTEAMRSTLGDRVIGICDSPVGLVRRACRALGLEMEQLDRIDYAGLNHLGWLRSLPVDSHDWLPHLIASPDLLARTEEGRLFGADLLQTLKVLPNEYVYYYLRTADAALGIARSGSTRGEQIARQQTEFYARATQSPQDAEAAWERARREREEGYLAEARAEGEARDEDDLAGGGYEQVALDVMSALAGGGARELIVNVANNATLPGLPDDMVIEVPALITPTGAFPLPVSPLDAGQLRLVSAVRRAERGVITAARTGSRAAAVEAFSDHPLVDDGTIATQLVDSVIADEPSVARLLS